MYVDWSVELGAGGPVRAFPWSRPEETSKGEIAPESASEMPSSGIADALCYYDLKADPSLVDQLPEARSSGELREFLLRVNAGGFPLQSAKCDHWFTQEISAEEEIFAAPCKFA